jgi:uncharacterized membrane protein
MNKMTKQALLAASVAGLMAASVTIVPQALLAQDAAKVPCYGINACKGTGECGGKGHSCAGKNACKGAGVVMTSSADECTQKGGSLEPKE